MNKLLLKPVEDSDIQLLTTWLNKEYILKWYHDADEWLNEIKERNGKFRFLNHFIVMDENHPVGFCQYYDCFYAQEDWYAVSNPNEIFSIDYLIGEENYLRKGYGKEIVKTLVNTIQQRWSKGEIVVQPDDENIASGKALLANGFMFDADKKYYSLKWDTKE